MAMHYSNSKYPQFTTSTPSVKSVKCQSPSREKTLDDTPSMVLTSFRSPTAFKKAVNFQESQDVCKSLTFDESRSPVLPTAHTPLRSSDYFHMRALSSEEEMDSDGLNDSYPMEDFLNHSVSYSKHVHNKMEQINKSISIQSFNAPHSFYFGSQNHSPQKESVLRRSNRKRFHILERKLEIIKNSMSLNDSISNSYKQLEALTPGSTTANLPNKFLDSEHGFKSKKEGDPNRSLLQDSSFFNSFRVMPEFVELKVVNTSEFAVIYRAKNRWDGKYYCLKRSKSDYEAKGVISKHDCIVEFTNEIAALSALNHDNIVRYYSTWREMEDTYIQLDYCPGGSLFSYLYPSKKFDTDRFVDSSPVRTSTEPRRHLSHDHLKNLLGQMSRAIEYLQNRGVLHADVKPSNILVDCRCRVMPIEKMEDLCVQCLISSNTDDIVFKMTDFGRACLLNGKLRDGDGRYLPLLTDNSSPMDVALGRDIYALGLTVFEASGGVIPEYHTKEHTQLKELGKLPDDHKIPQDLIDVVRKMVSPSAKNRPRINEILCHSTIAPYSQTRSLTSNLQILNLSNSNDVVMEQSDTF